MKDCVWRVRKQCTKVRECKNSGVQGTDQGGGSAWRFPLVSFSQPLLGPLGGNSGREEAADSNATLWGTDLCCSEVVWSFELRECQLHSHCSPHIVASQTTSPLFYRKGDRGSQWWKRQPQNTELSGQNWDLISRPSESRH